VRDRALMLMENRVMASAMFWDSPTAAESEDKVARRRVARAERVMKLADKLPLAELEKLLEELQ
jgi:hypothetical protein